MIRSRDVTVNVIYVITLCGRSPNYQNAVKFGASLMAIHDVYNRQKNHITPF